MPKKTDIYYRIPTLSDKELENLELLLRGLAASAVDQRSPYIRNHTAVIVMMDQKGLKRKESGK